MSSNAFIQPLESRRLFSAVPTAMIDPGIDTMTSVTTSRLEKQEQTEYADDSKAEESVTSNKQELNQQARRRPASEQNPLLFMT